MVTDMALKVRKNRSPAPPNACPLSACMQVLGGAWTPNIIWNLSGGPRRFSELRVDIPKASAKVLTARLRAQTGRAAARERVGPYGVNLGVGVTLKKKQTPRS